MIEISLHPDLEAHYAALAKDRGIPLGEYIAEKLQRAYPLVRPPSQAPQTTPEERVADMDRFFKEMTRYSHEIPPGLYDDETFDREFIYGDHP